MYVGTVIVRMCNNDVCKCTYIGGIVLLIDWIELKIAELVLEKDKLCKFFCIIIALNRRKFYSITCVKIIVVKKPLI